MYTCPKCTRTFDEAEFQGWICKVMGRVKIDDNGKTVTISPLKAITTIKQGEELNAFQGLLRCPHCRFESAIKNFPVVRRCRFTGLIGNVAVTHPELGTIWINDQAHDLINHVMELAMQWENPIAIGEDDV